MRPCKRCISRGLECRTSLESSSDKCAECVRVSHPCSLVVTPREFAAVDSQLEKVESDLQLAREAKRRARLLEQEARDRISRLKAHRQKLLEKKGEMVSRELQNIEELEADEALAALGPLPQSPTSFSQVSFGSLSRTSPVPTSSS
jgi:hypothetical protein